MQNHPSLKDWMSEATERSIKDMSSFNEIKTKELEKGKDSETDQNRTVQQISNEIDESNKVRLEGRVSFLDDERLITFPLRGVIICTVAFCMMLGLKESLWGLARSELQSIQTSTPTPTPSTPSVSMPSVQPNSTLEPEVDTSISPTPSTPSEATSTPTGELKFGSKVTSIVPIRNNRAGTIFEVIDILAQSSEIILKNSEHPNRSPVRMDGTEFSLSFDLSGFSNIGKVFPNLRQNKANQGGRNRANQGRRNRTISPMDSECVWCN